MNRKKRKTNDVSFDEIVCATILSVSAATLASCSSIDRYLYRYTNTYIFYLRYRSLFICTHIYFMTTGTSVWLSRILGFYRFVVLFETGIFVEIILRLSLVLYSYLYGFNLFCFSIQLIIFFFSSLTANIHIFFHIFVFKIDNLLVFFLVLPLMVSPFFNKIYHVL